MGFIGQEIFSLDNKGRINIPSKMRKYLSDEAKETFIVTNKGFEPCIIAYPKDIWEKKYEAIFSQLDPFDEKSNRVLREMLSNSEEVKLDAQQRIMLSKELLKIAKIDSKVRIMGVLDHIEFWNPDEYDRYKANFDTAYKDDVREVMVN